MPSRTISLREQISRCLLHYLETHEARLFPRIELQILLCLTAKAFSVPAKNILFMSCEKALETYALFTHDAMARSTERERIYNLSRSLGERIRSISGLKDTRDLDRLIFYLYKNLDIIMEGDFTNGVKIPHCYFSNLYSPSQCAIMSAMDSGIVAGIHGGTELTFQQRLTEGHPFCLAFIERRTE